MPTLFTKVATPARARWRERRLYTHYRHWLIMLYNRVLLRLQKAPLPFRHRVVAVKLAMLPQPVLVRLGTSDWLVLEEVFYKGEYDAVRRLAPHIRTVLDLGANVGYSVRLWQHLYHSPSVVAVEPDASNADLCRKNTAVAGHANVSVIQKCVASTTRTVYLDKKAGAWAYAMTDTNAACGEPIDTVTVDELMSRDFGANGVDLLKCDIEGAEAEVFKSCSGWISNVMLLIVEVHGDYTVADLQTDIRNGGGCFHLVGCDEKGRCATAVLKNAKLPAVG